MALPVSLGDAEVECGRGSYIETLGRIYGVSEEQAAPVAILGTPERAAEQVAAYAAAGVDRIVLSFPTDDWERQYELGTRVRELVEAG
ncbi:hypothetical protein [Embleya sp. NBC_00896]|uniref:hypothetical protein n=1 Tax=Embleya sp. NBC_00896 TaxID=2975961 RepID=UPI00386A4689|nr:hypothetical protein OG928_05255 [Embleya sp. NBC_00896]